MFVINPSKEQLATSDIDIMIGASEDSVAMVEGEFDEISEEEMLDAIRFWTRSNQRSNSKLKLP